jgi:hypothetical protein
MDPQASVVQVVQNTGRTTKEEFIMLELKKEKVIIPLKNQIHIPCITSGKPSAQRR